MEETGLPFHSAMKSLSRAKATGLVIKKWRLRRGLGQKELAAKAGLSSRSIGAFERGQRTASLLIQAKLCTVLELSPEVFLEEIAREEQEVRKLRSQMTGQSEEAGTVPAEEELSAAWDAVSNYFKTVFLAIVEARGERP